MISSHSPVSFDSESLVLVDSDDKPVGSMSKKAAHAGDGTLHRAFSIFLFTHCGKVLLQKRSSKKPLWPGYWSNACCSHPRTGESYSDATTRRLREELGVSLSLTRLFQFEYHALFGEVGAEHELCTVFAGKLTHEITINPHPSEVSDWGWFDCDDVDRWQQRDAHEFSPWFKLEWQRLRQDFPNFSHPALMNLP